MGPILILDKSAIQSLSLDEAVWLDQFFAVNVTPLLYVETLADLTVTDKKGRKGEEIVADLAAKSPINATFPNIHHFKLIEQDLLGNKVQMQNRPVISGGQPKRSPEGKVGFQIDEFPEQAAMARWYEGDFWDIEHQHARNWRQALAELDLESTLSWINNVVPTGVKLNSMDAIKQFVGDFTNQGGVEVLELELHLLGLSETMRIVIRKRYVQTGCPSLEAFAPYAAYVCRIELFFYLCASRGFIAPERVSNKVDMAYLYYLPFCMAFVSGDKLHARTAELFMEHDQQFVKAEQLKSALKELSEYYEAHMEEIEKVGLMRYVAYPPTDKENLVSELWDKFMRPNWRDVERERQADDGLPSNPELAAAIKRQMEESTPAEFPEDPNNVDFAIVSRKHPIRKGKWRLLPPEVEDRAEINDQ